MTESIKLINFFGSIFTLTAMAIDRFILICKPKVGSYNKSRGENIDYSAHTRRRWFKIIRAYFKRLFFTLGK